MKKVVIVLLVVFLMGMGVPVFAIESAEETEALHQMEAQAVISIGVMPIENAQRIPHVGDAFRQILVSALNESGIKVVESMDDETLYWVRRQDQLVREGWIDSYTAPAVGELYGITHFLLGIVTQYQEAEVMEEVMGGIFYVNIDGERIRTRVQTGSLAVDFRVVDARTGVVEVAFGVKVEVRRSESAIGSILTAIFGGTKQKKEIPLPEEVARSVAEQAAERIAAVLFVK
ncbi:MAG: hypothetical protein NT012_02285 [Candidatus Nealsonbacteria bacterium]|nr:hypothetical protein [Candidatus Nealsonbacteria bacterium]